MDDWFADKPVYTGPTTDEMDHTTPEERYKLVAICGKCHEPHYFTGSKDRFMQTTGEVCQCGGRSFYDLRSARTFNPLAKRKKPKR
jgi:thymidine kinase